MVWDFFLLELKKSSRVFLYAKASNLDHRLSIIEGFGLPRLGVREIGSTDFGPRARLARAARGLPRRGPGSSAVRLRFSSRATWPARKTSSQSLATAVFRPVGIFAFGRRSWLDRMAEVFGRRLSERGSRWSSDRRELRVEGGSRTSRHQSMGPPSIRLPGSPGIWIGGFGPRAKVVRPGGALPGRQPSGRWCSRSS